MNRPATPPGTPPIASLWDEAAAASMSEPERLLYRSHLLGSDLRITNFGGGNTSAKIHMAEPLTGVPTPVLWIKGSGGDLGSARLDGFATLYMDRLLALKRHYRGLAHEDEMVGLLAHCTFNLNPRAPSIDTALHAFIDRAHVDHMHPDAVIAIAASEHGEALTRQIFEGRLAWVPWQRPGFDLGLRLEQALKAHPQAEGLVLQNHGLFTWGDSSRQCYENTVGVIAQAHAWLKAGADQPAFAGPRFAPLDAERRRQVAQRLVPALRGRIGDRIGKQGCFDDSLPVLEFVCSQDLRRLAQLGTSCPDHFLRTKIRPLVLDYDPVLDNIDAVIAGLDEAVRAYRDSYAAYYQRCRRDGSPAMRDPHAVIYLIPGVGMLSFQKDRATARVAAEFYINAIHVMREAERLGGYTTLPEQEAFDIEYWPLEEAKLQRLPQPRSLAGRVAFITGGAGGIGRATAQRLLAEGACVLLADIDPDALAAAQSELAAEHGEDPVAAIRCDVTDEGAVEAAMGLALSRFGGLDIVVSNAGIASSAPLHDTSLALWQQNMEVLATGYFLVARTGLRILRAQGLGGSMVFVASKNGLVASAGASAYCTAKAAEIHLARCLALEGADAQIRVNVVNPDAVIRGSRIWSSQWRQQRAHANQIDADEVEDFYRQRSLLRRSVLAQDIAEGIYFFASDLSAKSTGNILNVDAGHAGAFTR